MFDSPEIRVNLGAIVRNWQVLKSRFTGHECGAVVKANAYGLGADAVASSLARAGCTTFFVATLEEGIHLRKTLPNHKIAVFHGVGHGEAMAFVQHKLVPVLNSPEQLARWKDVAKDNRQAVSILHLDTAMARLGFTRSEWEQMDEKMLDTCRVSVLMTHLACASDIGHASNDAQIEKFEALRAQAPNLPCSVANSGGILLGKKFHYQLARPGCALYGINPQTAEKNVVENVVELSAPILQIRTLDDAQDVGYGGTATLPKGSKIATVAMGYADGFLRCLSNRTFGFIENHRVPLIGRVTMDMLCFDVSNVPEDALAKAGRLVLLGAQQSVDEMAGQAGTIGYEIFTRLGARVRRVYEGGAA